MAKVVLKKSLKLEGAHFAGCQFTGGSEIKRTDREKYVTHNLRCRIIIVGGAEYAALDAAVDEVLKD